jgi:cell division protein FtsQ
MVNGCKNLDCTRLQNEDYVRQLVGNSIIKTDIHKLRERLIESPMVSEAIVKKVYPHFIMIEIIERYPILLIVDNKQNYIYDKNGNTVKIDSKDVKKYDFLQSLVYVEGDNILDEIKDVATLFLGHEFSSRINGIYKIGERRWDMVIDKKLKVMLPEKITRSNLASIFNMIDNMKLKNNIKNQALYTILDARVKGKIFIRNIVES